jgi:hypothetical protein
MQRYLRIENVLRAIFSVLKTPEHEECAIGCLLERVRN